VRKTAVRVAKLEQRLAGLEAKWGAAEGEVGGGEERGDAVRRDGPGSARDEETRTPAGGLWGYGAGFMANRAVSPPPRVAVPEDPLLRRERELREQSWGNIRKTMRAREYSAFSGIYVPGMM
jgi:hypothetical protein